MRQRHETNEDDAKWAENLSADAPRRALRGKRPWTRPTTRIMELERTRSGFDQYISEHAYYYPRPS